MPKPTTPGQPIKARLSGKFDPRRGGCLSPGEAALARNVIRSLSRTDTSGIGAQGTWRGHAVIVERGRIAYGTVAKQHAESSVADAVCAAVRAGLFVKSSQASAQDAPDGADSSGDAGGSASGGSGDADGSGSGDGSGDGSGSASDDGNGSGSGSAGDDDSSGDAAGDAQDGENGDGDAETSEDDSAAQNGAGSAQDDQHSLEYLIRRLREIDDYCSSQESEVTDPGVSNVPYKFGARMLAAGIPVDAILHSWGITWPETARRSVGIRQYDPAAEFANPVPDRHPLYGYVRALIEADVPVYLCGPTQAGKSYVLEQVADDLGLPFRACPLTGGASSSWLLGAWTPNGFVEAGFPQVYGGGGVFLFDEVDAADPNMIIVLNNALANGSLENPRQGVVIPRSADFRPVAAANTWATGATAEYTGRQRQDKALSERFRVGRVAFGYDRETQAEIARREYEGRKVPDVPPAVAHLIEQAEALR